MVSTLGSPIWFPHLGQFCQLSSSFTLQFGVPFLLSHSSVATPYAAPYGAISWVTGSPATPSCLSRRNSATACPHVTLRRSPWRKWMPKADGNSNRNKTIQGLQNDLRIFKASLASPLIPFSSFLYMEVS